MPATIEIPTTRPGRTFTLSAFPDGSDTAALTSVPLTESGTRPGVYSFSNDTATGLHLLIAYDNGTPVWQSWAVLGTDGVIVASETREAAILAQGLTSNGEVPIAASVRDTILNAIGTPLQSDDYVAPPTVETIRDAVWSAVTRTLTEIDIDQAAIAESIASTVSAALVGSALSSNDVQQLRYQLGLDGPASAPSSATPHLTLGLSTASLQQLLALKQIRVSVPTLIGNELNQPLVQGDNYSAALGSAIEFSRTDFPDIPSESTCRLIAQERDCPAPSSFVIDGTVAVASETKVLRFEATSAESMLWKPGRYEFQVDVTFPTGEVRSFVGPNAQLRVLARLDAA
jgi:hypothetical protein